MLGKGLRHIAKPPTKEEREGLIREEDMKKVVDLRFEKRHIVGLWEGRIRQDVL